MHMMIHVHTNIALPCILLICKWTQIYCSVFLHHFYNANKYLVIHVFIIFLQVQNSKSQQPFQTKISETRAISVKAFYQQMPIFIYKCKYSYVSVCDGRPTCYYRHQCHSYSSCDLVLESYGPTRRVCREGVAPHSEVVVIGWDLGP